MPTGPVIEAPAGPPGPRQRFRPRSAATISFLFNLRSWVDTPVDHG